jgi:type IV secretory pathway VirB2 component (pilin)
VSLSGRWIDDIQGYSTGDVGKPLFVIGVIWRGIMNLELMVMGIVSVID